MTQSSSDFDLHEMPFSTFGSWLAVTPVVGLHRYADDLHLVSHRTGLHPVLALVPCVEGRRVDTRWSGRPDRLGWCSPEGSIEATFETSAAVRFRGRGLDLDLRAAAGTLSPFAGAYLFVDPLDRAAVLTHYGTGQRYRITCLRGAVEVTGDEALGTVDRAVRATGDSSGEWEVVVEEFGTAGAPFVSTVPFDRLARAAEDGFGAFVDDVGAWRTAATPGVERAAYVLWSATVEPAGYLRRPAVLMSKHWMNKVWSWDHCFNALAIGGGRAALALDQFLTPFDHQDPSGALPDSVTHSELLYNFVKPPIHGWAWSRLRPRLGPVVTADLLREVYDKLVALTSFWLTCRRAPGRPLAHYHHGNDSGWDNASTFDVARVLETPDLAALLTQQLTVVADLAAELGREDEHLVWRRESERVRAALLSDLWDGDGFASRNPRTGALSRSASLLDLLPITLGAGLPAPVAAALAARVERHLTSWGLATEPVGSPRYEPDGYWRGPIWAPSTILVEDGLRRAGFTALADQVSERFRRLCETSGFAENFDAVTGAGLRDRCYTWTASAYLVLAREYETRRRGEA